MDREVRVDLIRSGDYVTGYGNVISVIHYLTDNEVGFIFDTSDEQFRYYETDTLPVRYR